MYNEIRLDNVSDIKTNSTKRCPIVLCLDISPSMGAYHRIDDLNSAIKHFYELLSKEQKVINSVEICVVTFSTEVYGQKDFMVLNSLKDKQFQTVEKGGTNTSAAIDYSYMRLINRIEELKETEIGNYLPYFVLVTDGDPDESDNSLRLENSVGTILNHCENPSESNPLIFPYIIGVGEHVSEKWLDRMAAKSTGQALMIDGDASFQRDMFKELFEFMANSVSNSLINGNLKETFDSIQKKSTRKNKEIIAQRASRKTKVLI